MTFDAFSDPPDVDLRTIAVEDRYENRSDIEYTANMGDWSETILVPEGFVTDGASIPRIFWRLIGSPFQPRYMRAALVHDFLYKNGLLTRRKADDIFRAFLLADEVGRVLASVMWIALRVGGSRNYKG